MAAKIDELHARMQHELSVIRAANQGSSQSLHGAAARADGDPAVKSGGPIVDESGQQYIHRNSSNDGGWQMKSLARRVSLTDPDATDAPVDLGQLQDLKAVFTRKYLPDRDAPPGLPKKLFLALCADLLCPTYPESVQRWYEIVDYDSTGVIDWKKLSLVLLGQHEAGDDAAAARAAVKTLYDENPREPDRQLGGDLFRCSVDDSRRVLVAACTDGTVREYALDSPDLHEIRILHHADGGSVTDCSIDPIRGQVAVALASGAVFVYDATGQFPTRCGPILRAYQPFLGGAPGTHTTPKIYTGGADSPHSTSDRMSPTRGAGQSVANALQAVSQASIAKANGNAGFGYGGGKGGSVLNTAGGLHLFKTVPYDPFRMMHANLIGYSQRARRENTMAVVPVPVMPLKTTFHAEDKPVMDFSGRHTIQSVCLSNGAAFNMSTAHPASPSLLGVGFDGGVVALYSDPELAVIPNTAPRALSPIAAWKPHNAAVSKLMVSSVLDYEGVLSGSEDGSICLYDVAHETTTFKVGAGPSHFGGIASAHGTLKAVSSIAMSPQYHAVASCGQGRSVNLWSLHTARSLATLREPQGRVLDVAFCEPNHQLIALAADEKLYIWDVRMMKLLQQASTQRRAYPQHAMSSMAVDPRFRTVICCAGAPYVFEDAAERQKRTHGSAVWPENYTGHCVPVEFALASDEGGGGDAGDRCVTVDTRHIGVWDTSGLPRKTREELLAELPTPADARHSEVEFGTFGPLNTRSKADSEPEVLIRKRTLPPRRRSTLEDSSPASPLEAATYYDAPQQRPASNIGGDQPSGQPTTNVAASTATGGIPSVVFKSANPTPSTTTDVQSVPQSALVSPPSGLSKFSAFKQDSKNPLLPPAPASPRQTQDGRPKTTQEGGQASDVTQPTRRSDASPHHSPRGVSKGREGSVSPSALKRTGQATREGLGAMVDIAKIEGEVVKETYARARAKIKADRESMKNCYNRVNFFSPCEKILRVAMAPAQKAILIHNGDTENIEFWSFDPPRHLSTFAAKGMDIRKMMYFPKSLGLSCPHVCAVTTSSVVMWSYAHHDRPPYPEMLLQPTSRLEILDHSIEHSHRDCIIVDAVYRSADSMAFALSGTFDAGLRSGSRGMSLLSGSETDIGDAQSTLDFRVGSVSGWGGRLVAAAKKEHEQSLKHKAEAEALAAFKKNSTVGGNTSSPQRGEGGKKGGTRRGLPLDLSRATQHTGLGQAERHLPKANVICLGSNGDLFVLTFEKNELHVAGCVRLDTVSTRCRPSSPLWEHAKRWRPPPVKLQDGPNGEPSSKAHAAELWKRTMKVVTAERSLGSDTFTKFKHGALSDSMLASDWILPVGPTALVVFRGDGDGYLWVVDPPVPKAAGQDLTLTDIAPREWAFSLHTCFPATHHLGAGCTAAAFDQENDILVVADATGRVSFFRVRCELFLPPTPQASPQASPAASVRGTKKRGATDSGTGTAASVSSPMGKSGKTLSSSGFGRSVFSPAGSLAGSMAGGSKTAGGLSQSGGKQQRSSPRRDLSRDVSPPMSGRRKTSTVSFDAAASKYEYRTVGTRTYICHPGVEFLAAFELPDDDVANTVCVVATPSWMKDAKGVQTCVVVGTTKAFTAVLGLTDGSAPPSDVTPGATPTATPRGPNQDSARGAGSGSAADDIPLRSREQSVTSLGRLGNLSAVVHSGDKENNGSPSQSAPSAEFEESDESNTNRRLLVVRVLGGDRTFETPQRCTNHRASSLMRPAPGHDKKGTRDADGRKSGAAESPKSAAKIDLGSSDALLESFDPLSRSSQHTRASASVSASVAGHSTTAVPSKTASGDDGVGHATRGASHFTEKSWTSRSAAQGSAVGGKSPERSSQARAHDVTAELVSDDDSGNDTTQKQPSVLAPLATQKRATRAPGPGDNNAAPHGTTGAAFPAVSGGPASGGGLMDVLDKPTFAMEVDGVTDEKPKHSVDSVDGFEVLPSLVPPSREKAQRPTVGPTSASVRKPPTIFAKFPVKKGKAPATAPSPSSKPTRRPGSSGARGGSAGVKRTSLKPLPSAQATQQAARGRSAQQRNSDAPGVVSIVGGSDQSTRAATAGPMSKRHRGSSATQSRRGDETKTPASRGTCQTHDSDATFAFRGHGHYVAKGTVPPNVNPADLVASSSSSSDPNSDGENSERSRRNPRNGRRMKSSSAKGEGRASSIDCESQDSPRSCLSQRSTSQRSAAHHDMDQTAAPTSPLGCGTSGVIGSSAGAPPSLLRTVDLQPALESPKTLGAPAVVEGNDEESKRTRTTGVQLDSSRKKPPPKNATTSGAGGVQGSFSLTSEPGDVDRRNSGVLALPHGGQQVPNSGLSSAAVSRTGSVRKPGLSFHRADTAAALNKIQRRRKDDHQRRSVDQQQRRRDRRSSRAPRRASSRADSSGSSISGASAQAGHSESQQQMASEEMGIGGIVIIPGTALCDTPIGPTEVDVDVVDSSSDDESTSSGSTTASERSRRRRSVAIAPLRTLSNAQLLPPPGVTSSMGVLHVTDAAVKYPTIAEEMRNSRQASGRISRRGSTARRRSSQRNGTPSASPRRESQHRHIQSADNSANTTPRRQAMKTKDPRPQPDERRDDVTATSTTTNPCTDDSGGRVSAHGPPSTAMSTHLLTHTSSMPTIPDQSTIGKSPRGGVSPRFAPGASLQTAPSRRRKKHREKFSHAASTEGLLQQEEADTAAVIVSTFEQKTHVEHADFLAKTLRVSPHAQSSSESRMFKSTMLAPGANSFGASLSVHPLDGSSTGSRPHSARGDGGSAGEHTASASSFMNGPPLFESFGASLTPTAAGGALAAGRAPAKSPSSLPRTPLLGGMAAGGKASSSKHAGHGPVPGPQGQNRSGLLSSPDEESEAPVPAFTPLGRGAAPATSPSPNPSSVSKEASKNAPEPTHDPLKTEEQRFGAEKSATAHMKNNGMETSTSRPFAPTFDNSAEPRSKSSDDLDRHVAAQSKRSTLGLSASILATEKNSSGEGATAQPSPDRNERSGVEKHRDSSESPSSRKQSRKKSFAGTVGLRMSLARRRQSRLASRSSDGEQPSPSMSPTLQSTQTSPQQSGAFVGGGDQTRGGATRSVSPRLGRTPGSPRQPVTVIIDPSDAMLSPNGGPSGGVGSINAIGYAGAHAGGPGAHGAMASGSGSAASAPAGPATSKMTQLRRLSDSLEHSTAESRALHQQRMAAAGRTTAAGVYGVGIVGSDVTLLGTSPGQRTSPEPRAGTAPAGSVSPGGRKQSLFAVPMQDHLSIGSRAAGGGGGEGSRSPGRGSLTPRRESHVTPTLTPRHDGDGRPRGNSALLSPDGAVNDTPTSLIRRSLYLGDVQATVFGADAVECLNGPSPRPDRSEQRRTLQRHRRSVAGAHMSTAPMAVDGESPGPGKATVSILSPSSGGELETSIGRRGSAMSTPAGQSPLPATTSNVGQQSTYRNMRHAAREAQASSMLNEQRLEQLIRRRPYLRDPKVQYSGDDRSATAKALRGRGGASGERRPSRFTKAEFVDAGSKRAASAMAGRGGATSYQSLTLPSVPPLRGVPDGLKRPKNDYDQPRPATALAMLL